MLTPNSWGKSIVNMAISLLAAAIAIHIAADLIRSVAPELIIVGAVIALVYVFVAIARYRRSRW